MITLLFIRFALFVDFAAALTNPIAYLSSLEKHSQQLAILEDIDVRQLSVANCDSICY